jgi:hypothetical protein
MITTTLECEPSPLVVDRADLRKWTAVIRAEYREFPGLSLTAAQVQRLWNLDRDTCRCLLDAMVRANFLRQTADGQYVRADWCRPCEACR